jgi:hypothetical protein
MKTDHVYQGWKTNPAPFTFRSRGMTEVQVLVKSLGCVWIRYQVLNL